jgi:CBS domain-containing protein
VSYLVKHYMRKEVPTVDANVTVIEGAKTMLKAGRGFLIILREGQPAGIVTEHDYVEKIVAHSRDSAKTTVAQIMSAPLITIDPDEDLIKASELMHEHNIRRLPVLRDGIVYGSITTKDISRALGQYVDRSVRDLMRWAAPFGQ